MACRLLLIPGSLRAASTNVAVLRTAARLTPPGFQGRLFDRLDALPHFNPDDDGDRVPAQVAALRSAIHSAAALVFSTPEYAGALPGSFKNLLDWTIGDDRPGSIYGKPVAWINASPRGADAAHAELRTVLGYAHAEVIDAACAHVPVTGDLVGEDGLLTGTAARDGIARALEILAAVLTPCASPGTGSDGRLTGGVRP